MRKYALAALGITAAAVAAVLVEAQPCGRGDGFQSPRGAADRRGSVGRQHGSLRVPQPDKPNTLTIVSNWIPGEDPAAGPNWYTFSPSARYNIKIDRNGRSGGHHVCVPLQDAYGPLFLGNTSQPFTVTRNGRAFAKGTTPPNNIGPPAAQLPRGQGLQGRSREVDRHQAGRREGLRRPA